LPSWGRFPKGGISEASGEEIPGVPSGRILRIGRDNKIAFRPLDEGPERCGMILAAAGIGQKREINS